MAGIFFEVFVLIAVLATVLMVFAFWKQKLSVLLFPVFLFALDGAILLSQGLAYESGSTYNSTSGTVTYVFSTATAATDSSIFLVGAGFIAFAAMLAFISFNLWVQRGEM